MPVDHTKNIIEIKNLSFSYGENVVLKNINLNIHQGDYLGVIGPNGSGKTTLLKLVLGLIKAQNGEVLLFGKNIHDFREWQKVGYVPQKAVNFDVKFPATVEEIVSMGRYGLKKGWRQLYEEDRQIVREALDHVGMTKYASRLIGDLSSGQQQRVFIARSLASKPEVLFLDEPTVGIDAEAEDQFYKLLHNLNTKLNLTLVIVSHDIDIIAREATEIVCINKELVYHGTPAAFVKDESLMKLYGKVVHGH